MKKKDVTLIGEEHTEVSHMEHVTSLVKEKFDTYPHIVIALEQDCVAKTAQDLCTLPSRNIRQQNLLDKKLEKQGITNKPDIINTNVQNFTKNMSFDDKEIKASYTRNLINIVKYTRNNNKSLSIIGIDTYDPKDKKDVKRDRVMHQNINKALKTSECLVYPVGSAHICNNEAPHENRLGTLLLSDKKVDLNLANLYQKGSDAYNFVNIDINAFKDKHPSYKREVIYQDLSNIEILDKQPSKLKLKPNVMPEKPVKINKLSDKQENNIERTDCEFLIILLPTF